MIIFLDTSAWVKYFLAEEGTLRALRIQQFLQNALAKESNRVVASPITYPEMIATFKRAQLGKRITQEELETILQAFEEQWKNTQILMVTTPLIKLAGHLAKDYALRGCDAFQLATALQALSHLFISADKELNEVASLCGIIVWNPTEKDFSEKDQYEEVGNDKS